jgi:hypothetical protein
MRIPSQEFRFPFPGWEDEFAPYKYFYIRGARAFLNENRIYKIDAHKRAPVPPELSRAVPRGDWHQLSQLQVSRILKGSNSRFDKIALFMLAIEAAVVAKYGLEGSLYEAVYISPAIFVVQDLEQILRVARRQELIKESSSAIKQSENFVSLSARMGYPMTYESAVALSDFLRTRGIDCSVRMLFDRSDRGRGTSSRRLKNPNEFEMVL